MKFVDRITELKFLNNYYILSKKMLVVLEIYGNRGIGKTMLVKEFCTIHKQLYFFVNESKESKTLLEEYEFYLKSVNILDKYAKLETWNQFLEIIFNKAEGYIIVFDEFQRFMQVDKSFFSDMQNFIDSNKTKKILLIFQGSSIGLMKRLFTDNSMPLYGRITNKLKLQELPIIAIPKLLTLLHFKPSAEAIVESFSLFGGYPSGYAAIEAAPLLLNKAKTKFNIYNIVNELFVIQYAPLRSTVEDILQQELGKRKGVYYSILQAVATGRNSFSEIADSTYIKPTSLPRYINDLTVTLGFMSKFSIITGRGLKNPKYKIVNPIVDLWFRIVYKNRSSIENLQFDEKNIKNIVNPFLGYRFEDFARALLLANQRSLLNFRFSDIGSWWGRNPAKAKHTNQEEIDLVALNNNTKNILFAECKWTNSEVDVDLYYDLQRKSRLVQWNNDKRKEHFALFSKSGFTDKMVKLAKEKNVLLFDLKAIEKALQ